MLVLIFNLLSSVTYWVSSNVWNLSNLQVNFKFSLQLSETFQTTWSRALVVWPAELADTSDTTVLTLSSDPADFYSTSTCNVHLQSYINDFITTMALKSFTERNLFSRLHIISFKDFLLYRSLFGLVNLVPYLCYLFMFLWLLLWLLVLRYFIS